MRSHAHRVVHSAFSAGFKQLIYHWLKQIPYIYDLLLTLTIHAVTNSNKFKPGSKY